MNKIGLVIGREFNERVRKKSFLITTLLTPLLMVAMIGGAMWMSMRGGSETKLVEVVDASGVVAGKLEDGGSLNYRVSERTLEEINAAHDGVWGTLVVGADVVENPSNVTLYAYSTTTIETESAIARAIEKIVEAERLKAYNIENLTQILADVKADVTLKAYRIDAESGEEKESSSGLAMALAYIFGFVMYMFVLIYGVQVMQGVIEEKNSKVLEVVVSSVRPMELMLGKIIGIALVAVTQFVIWIVVIAVLGGAVMRGMVPTEMAMGNIDPTMAAMMTGAMNPGTMGMMVGLFLVYFIGGYLLYAAMFAAVGSAVDNVQDAQQFQTPITLPIILGFVGMMSAMRDPGGDMALWLSMIPFTSPMVMVARIPYGVPGWEIALSVALLIGTFVAMAWLAGKIYRVGIFMYGKKPSFAELAKWVRYKS